MITHMPWNWTHRSPELDSGPLGKQSMSSANRCKASVNIGMVMTWGYMTPSSQQGGRFRVPSVVALTVCVICWLWHTFCQ